MIQTSDYILESPGDYWTLTQQNQTGIQLQNAHKFFKLWLSIQELSCNICLEVFGMYIVSAHAHM